MPETTRSCEGSGPHSPRFVQEARGSGSSDQRLPAGRSAPIAPTDEHSRPPSTRSTNWTSRRPTRSSTHMPERWSPSPRSRSPESPRRPSKSSPPNVSSSARCSTNPFSSLCAGWPTRRYQHERASQSSCDAPPPLAWTPATCMRSPAGLPVHLAGARTRCSCRRAGSARGAVQ